MKVFLVTQLFQNQGTQLTEIGQKRRLLCYRDPLVRRAGPDLMAYLRTGLWIYDVEGEKHAPVSGQHRPRE